MRENMSMAIALVGIASLAPVALAAETLPDGFPTQRGRFAFTSAQILANPGDHAEELEYLSQFDVVLTNGLGIAPEATRDHLQAQGCELFLYFWTNGLYAENRVANPPMGDWCDTLVARPRINFIGGVPLPSLAGKPAYYYDLTNGELVDRLCAEMAKSRAETGYDGIFFDYTGVYPLPPEVLEVWQREHPDTAYDEGVLDLLRRLREVDPECLIFTNQAHRADVPLLAEADYDLAESLATSFMWGPETEIDGEKISETYFRTWPGEFGIEGSYGEPERAARETPPRRDMFYLDYMQPRYRTQADEAPEGSLDLEAVYYSYCAAALWGRAAACSGWYAGHEYRGPLHFADLGDPLGDGPVEEDGAVVREYQRGLVVLTAGVDPVSIPYPVAAGEALYDLFSSAWIEPVDGECELTLAPGVRSISGEPHPIGRVYLKTSRTN